MSISDDIKSKVKNIKENENTQNFKQSITKKSGKFLFSLFRFVILVGVSYVILGPIIGVIAKSFFSDADVFNPMVYLIPSQPTLERYQRVIARMDYVPVVLKSLAYSITLMAIQVLICAMTGYGFAKYNFPFKKLLFACVVIMIVLPAHTIMLPLYTTFAQFDPLGIVSLFNGKPVNLLSTSVPMYIMTALGCGLRSGIYIYIFNQFFRGLPKEIEEAAYVDGAKTFYTFFNIMLPNALPSILTVSIFSLVWQYNDTFYGKLFLISQDTLISKRIASLQSTIAIADRIYDVNIQQLYLNAGIVLVLLPLLIIYVILQKYFIEGVERSGIVG